MRKHFVVRQSKRNEKNKKKYRTAAMRFTEAIIARTTTAATIVNGCFSISVTMLNLNIFITKMKKKKNKRNQEQEVNRNAKHIRD